MTTVSASASGQAFAAGTIVARNYLAHARVLARSFESHEPDAVFFTLLVDGTEHDRALEGLGTVVLPSELGIPADALARMLTIYDALEACTALKPAFLRHLLATTGGVAAYLDPDTRLYASIEDVAALAAEHSIVLTPHTIAPMPRDGLGLSESDVMHAGMFNLGFIAVGLGASGFLDWWHERLLTDAIVDLPNALFTDQRWVDWVPSLFPHRIVRDAGLNVAYWNLHERPISRTPGGVLAGASTLRLMHFSGFDPSDPTRLSKHAGDRPRVRLAEHPDLADLCRAYAAELAEFDVERSLATPYGWGRLANGLELSPTIRRVVRHALLRPDEFPVIPDAFGDEGAFTTWLVSGLGGGFGPVSPFAFAIWLSRTDLQVAFPAVPGVDAVRFHEWCILDPATKRRYRRIKALVPKRPRPESDASERVRNRAAYGWSVVAHTDLELGVGEAGRRLASAVAATGVPMELVKAKAESHSRAQHDPLRRSVSSVGHANVVSCVNADQLPILARRMGLRETRGWHVGLWFWELESFPRELAASAAILDEVWTASEFTRAAIQKVTDKPVRLIRLPITIPAMRTAFTRRSLGLPDDRFVFLTNFDYLSIMRRKNPMGVIAAYRDAFEERAGATLVVKSINGHLRPAESAAVRAVAGGRGDILFLDDYVTNGEMRAMIELADCYVSLHRSEGYGLNLADAMAAGTPTIATAYSGNLTFQSPDTAELIPYTLARVGPGAAPYQPDAVWAEPDGAAASEAMVRIFSNPLGALALARRARDMVEREHSLEAAARSMMPVVAPFSPSRIGA